MRVCEHGPPTTDTQHCSGLNSAWESVSERLMQGFEKGGPVLQVSRKALRFLGVLKLCLAEATPLYKILNERHKRCVLFMQGPLHELYVLLYQLLEVAGDGMCRRSQLSRRVDCNIGERAVVCGAGGQPGALLRLHNTAAAPYRSAVQSRGVEDFDYGGKAVDIPLAAVGAAGKLLHAYFLSWVEVQPQVLKP